MEEYLQDIISNLLHALKVDFDHVQIDIKQDFDGDDYYYCNIITKDASILIGKKGRNIQAIQHLVKLILFKRTNNDTKISIDVDSYRERQEETVRVIAERHVQKVLENGQSQALPPMTPYFRRVVHMHLTENFKDIETQSRGYGERRHIVISKKS